MRAKGYVDMPIRLQVNQLLQPSMLLICRLYRQISWLVNNKVRLLCLDCMLNADNDMKLLHSMLRLLHRRQTRRRWSSTCHLSLHSHPVHIRAFWQKYEASLLALQLSIAPLELQPCNCGLFSTWTSPLRHRKHVHVKPSMVIRNRHSPESD
ncbi:hypothetical protein M441DRAFT_343985 [Trichoderma asperellum CBS 433.97]|uniref:Uncharacterized protein n=1 Tax=Trichoderma asperellum (strain ATCC 204424 / CBS 433.97 / NBRC 101777) TaxID=1042311 RepID=A0A2T3ZHB6_TRIA4|nr:hypothetical protein M441DRAFT_343985 [Trichoderma asperellum CBS 433.97]PTB44204.1 hypothetical protein M441DRAFT_343985 [Trichoderma asperellum CBS 433.97]